MAQIFMLLVSIVILGWLWFYIARPILVDWGWLTVDENGEITSSQAPVQTFVPVSDRIAMPSDADAKPDGRTDAPKATPDQYITLFRSLRAHGYTRDEVRTLLAPWLKVSNDLWTEAKPEPKPADDAPIAFTPVAQRPYNPKAVRFEYDDPALNYAPPETA